MSANTYTLRLKRELKAILQEPVPNIIALPSKNNILEWHYVITGPKGSVYEGGVYHGKIVFSTDYPLKPPSIYMITPNGRFETNKRLCLSMSDYHPESWNPMWSVSSILTGLLSFMLESTPTVGSLNTSDAEKRRLVFESMRFNRTNLQFKKMFPQFMEGELLSKGNTESATLPQSPTSVHDLSFQLGLLIFSILAIIIYSYKYS